MPENPTEEDGAILDNLTGFEFEELMVDVFRHMGFEEVRRTERTGDKGRDILMKESQENGDSRCVIVECKHTKQVSSPIIQKTHSAVNGNSYVGGLIGLNRGSVVNCHAAGDVLCQKTIGGVLIGMNQGSVDKCYSSGGKASDVRYPSGGIASDAPGTTNYIGGLVGSNRGSISRSYSTASVKGAWGVGGLVGGCFGRISNSYSTGSVILGRSEFRFKRIGGLVGYNSDTWEKNVSNSFWNIETSGINESEGGTGLTSEEMRETETFTNAATKGLDEPWDFVGNPNDDTENKDIWNIDESGKINDGYPYLTGLERRGEGLARYELSTSVNPSSGGSVSLEPPGRTYKAGAKITITAEPAKGYEFDHWEGDYPAGERRNRQLVIKIKTLFGRGITEYLKGSKEKNRRQKNQRNSDQAPWPFSQKFQPSFGLIPFDF